MPLSPHLNVQVIDTINRAIIDGMRAEPGRGLEIGGILLGSVEPVPGSPTIVRIERFESVESEHRHGSSYGLTDRDRRVLGRKLAWWNKHAHKENLRPVGFFRSHTRRGLYLDNDDFLTIQNYFPEQQSVFLLVRPVAGSPGVAGFFFWQDGDIHRESSFQEFPFDAAKLPLVSPAPVERRRSEDQAGHGCASSRTTWPKPVPPPVAKVKVAPVLARRKPLPTWLRLAAPIAVGIALGAIVFKVTTAGMFRPAPVRQTQAAVKPAPVVAPAPEVQKPSPLQPTSRPTLAKPPSPVPAETKPPKREVVVPATSSPSPSGSASRAESGPTASVAVSRPPEPPPPFAEPTPAPPVALAPSLRPCALNNRIVPQP